MMRPLLQLATFLFTIFIVVCIHEYGHFIVARMFGIKAKRFAIGFGKPIWIKKLKSGLELVIGWLPIGGYVSLLDEREHTVAPEDLPFAFNHRPIYQRFLVMIAGVGFNLIFAWLAFWFVLTQGITYIKPIVGEVLPHSLVAEANVKPGQEIVAIDGQLTKHWPAVAMALVSHYGEKGQLKITFRDLSTQQLIDQSINIDLLKWRLDALRPNPLSSLGIVPLKIDKEYVVKNPDKNVLNFVKYPVLQAFAMAYQSLMSFINFNLTILYKMITGVISWKSLSGPFSIWQATVHAAGQGVVIYINFVALLSISIVIINLIPIPGLDGAQIVYLFIEAIRRKPLSIAVQLLLFRLGFIVMALFLTQVVINDIWRWI